jgi:hypothetical protein
MTGSDAFEVTIERLSGYACGMLIYEQNRMQQAATKN